MKHDENKDLKSFSRIGGVNYSDKTLRASKNATIGIHLWGRIDYLTKHCGWHFIWDNSVFNQIPIKTDESSSSNVQKKYKEHKLTDKTKRTSKKK